MLQYRTAPSVPPPLTLSRPASSKAFSSACKHKHSSNPTPIAEVDPVIEVEVEVEVEVASKVVGREREGPNPSEWELHRPHPPSEQFRTKRGVPLYPVLTTRFSRTSTAPTLVKD